MEDKHLPGQHNQESHGHRFSRRPGRLLMRAAGRPSRPRREAPGPLPLRAVTSPAVAEAERRREKSRAASPKAPRVVRIGPTESDRTASESTEEAAATSSPEVGKEPDKSQPIPQALGALSDGELEQWLVVAAERDDEDAMERIAAELDRRDDEPWGTPQEQADFLDALAKSKKPKSEREQAKEAYQDYVHAMYVKAIDEVGVHLWSKEGMQAGISDLDLFTGALRRDQVKKYASEDLLRWLGEPGNQRLTETEFINEWLGRATVADRQKTRGSLSEHG